MFRLDTASRFLTTTAVVIAAAGLITATSLASPSRVDNSRNMDGNTSPVFPAGSSPFGKTFGEWSAEHWKWLYSIPASSNPGGDVTGANGAVGQSGRVWFLAGSFCPEPPATCSDFTVTRNLSIPIGTALFFPVLDAECSTLEGNGYTDAELRACASGFMDLGSGMSCDIDGVSINDLQSYRVQSPLFTFGPLPANNILGAPAGSTSPSVSDGVFLMVKPLSPGAHTIHFTGAVSAFGFGMHINYNLAVGGQMVTAGSLQGAAQAVGSGTDGPLPRKGLTWGRLKSIYR